MRLTPEEAEAFLQRRAEDLAVATGRQVRSRPLFDKPLWKDAEGNLLTESKTGPRYVMVQFERPLMEASASILCRNGGTILNVGFGLGLVDTAIQSHDIQQHVIVEAHEQVLKWMAAEGWMQRPNVEVIPRRWEDIDWSSHAHRFDGVYFDPFFYDATVYPDVWRRIVRTILKPKTGVVVLYGPQTTEDDVQEIASFWEDVRIERHTCSVDVRFVVPEWERYGLGPTTTTIYAMTFD